MRKLFTLLFVLIVFTAYAAESDNKSDEKIMQTIKRKWQIPRE